MYNYKIKTKYIIIFLSIVIAIVIFIYLIRFLKKEFYKDNMIIKIKNPLDNTDMLWEDSNFTRNNFPNYDFEVDEKKKIFEYCKNNKYNHGVIDVGAHIGDLSIPLALALKNINREDIIVYAIDPSLEKCNFIKKISALNNIKNIKILNYGLSDKKKILSHNEQKDHNTGGQSWNIPTESINLNVSTYDKEANIFIEADELLHKDIGMIGVYHIDVEGHEIDVLKGSKTLINKYKPILFIEDWINLSTKCKSRNECPKLFETIEDINSLYKNTGILPNGDLIFEYIDSDF